jgi:hypothetical protein
LLNSVTDLQQIAYLLFFLILATGFSNEKFVTEGNIKFATDYLLLMKKINI